MVWAGSSENRRSHHVSRSAMSFEARQLFQSSAQHLVEFVDPEPQNPGAGFNLDSKENPQYKTVTGDRGKQEKPLKLLRVRHGCRLRLCWKISTPLNRRLGGFDKENIIGNAAAL
jgi:hypothetical protein